MKQRVNVSYSGYYGFTLTAIKEYDVMNSSEYIQLKKWATYNSSVGIRVGIVGGPFFQLYIFGAVHYVIFFNSSRKTIITAITNVDFSLVSTFRRDQEYAVGTAGTINGCCRSVFQYTDAFYIIVIDFVQSTGKRKNSAPRRRFYSKFIAETFPRLFYLKSSENLEIEIG